MALRLSTGLRNKLLGTASFASTMQNGVIRIYPGVQPTSADDAEGVSHLLEVTVSSGAFTPGTATNGLTFEQALSRASTNGTALNTAAWPGTTPGATTAINATTGTTSNTALPGVSGQGHGKIPRGALHADHLGF